MGSQLSSRETYPHPCLPRSVPICRANSIDAQKKAVTFQRRPFYFYIKTSLLIMRLIQRLTNLHTPSGKQTLDVCDMILWAELFILSANRSFTFHQDQ